MLVTEPTLRIIAGMYSMETAKYMHVSCTECLCGCIGHAPPTSITLSKAEVLLQKGGKASKRLRFILDAAPVGQPLTLKPFAPGIFFEPAELVVPVGQLKSPRFKIKARGNVKSGYHPIKVTLSSSNTADLILMVMGLGGENKIPLQAHTSTLLYV